MTRHYLKRASKTHATDSTDVQNIVQKMLAEIEKAASKPPVITRQSWIITPCHPC